MWFLKIVFNLRETSLCAIMQENSCLLYFIMMNEVLTVW